MDNILRDGTQIDQTVFKDLNLNETASPAVSDFIVVPALYTGNLHIEIVAKEECEIHGEEITPEDEDTGEGNTPEDEGTGEGNTPEDEGTGEGNTPEDEDTIELSPYIDIEYFDREKNSVFKLEKYVNIPIGEYSAGTIMSEFSLPFKFLKNIENGDKCYYVKISLNYVQDTSSGILNAYLLWI